MQKRTKSIVAAVALAAVVLVGVIAWTQGRTKAVEVKIDPVTRRDLVASVTASGQVASHTKVDVASDVSGRITRLAVKEGDMVKKGQFLLQIDPSQYQAAVVRNVAAVASSHAQVAQAKATLAQAQSTYNRTVDLIDKYHPDLTYFDDTALPLWPVSDAGLKIAAHFYNRQNQWHGADDDGVLFGKILDPEQRQCMAWDIERGSSNEIEPHPWQTDTCIGSWHYDQRIPDRHGYKAARTVVHTLVDVVSKNGNLLLSVPVKGDGTLDADELAIVEGIADWMQVNQEAIHGTRPWKVFGEGPQMESAAPIQAQGFNEGKGRPFTAEDVRFTTKGRTLYAIVMGAPHGRVAIKSLGAHASLLGAAIGSVELLGGDAPLTWSQTPDALAIDAPAHPPSDIAVVFKITPRD